MPFAAAACFLAAMSWTKPAASQAWSPQVEAAAGWRSMTLRNGGSASEAAFQGQTYRFNALSAFGTSWLAAGAGIERSYLRAAGFGQDLVITQPTLIIKAGHRFLPDFRLDVSVSQALNARLNRRQAARAAEGDFPLATPGTPTGGDGRINGTYYGMILEWTGNLGLGLIAGAEAAGNVRLTETAGLGIERDWQWHAGTVLRF